MNIINFQIETNGPVPVIKQIQEQIKLSIAMGVLKRGDVLPSIREVEKQTGVNRGIIHRAYLALRRSGLLVLTRGRGSVIVAPTSSARSTSDKCLQLSKSTLSKARQIGVPPTVFARYLLQQAKEAERSEPFISYVDDVKEVAERRAAEISRLWQVPVVGMPVLELKKALRKGSMPRKVLANHLRRNYIRSIVRSKKIDIIPIEVGYTEQTIKDLAKIKANSSALRILAPMYVDHAHFIIAQLQKWVRAPRVEISWTSVRDISDFEKLLNGSQYDRIIMDPGILGSVPEKFHRNPRILLVRLQLNPASLEAARIRAGVII